MSMEFWGVKVVAGKQCKVDPGAGRVIHVTQAALHIHNSKKLKDNDVVNLFVEIDDEGLVLGKLSPEGIAQQFDLVFEKEFVLSHSGKTGSVYIFGYSSVNPVEIATKDASDDGADSVTDNSSKENISDEDKKSKAEDGERSEDSEGSEDSEDDGCVKLPTPRKPECGRKRPFEIEDSSNKKRKLAGPEKIDTRTSKMNGVKLNGAHKKALRNAPKST